MFLFVTCLSFVFSSLSVGDSVIHNQEAIADHFVQHFASAFVQCHEVVDTGLVERVIPRLITIEENLSLMQLPTSQKVLAVVKGLDGFSAPGPDGFEGCFFTHCWDVVGQDLTLAVQSFFTNDFILPHFNSNLLILIPKALDSEEITDFRPIALANFIFKITTKIVA